MPKARLMAAEPLSPELVLVSPDLREEALGSLPPIDPDALFVVARPPAPAHAPAPPERNAPLPMAVAAYTVEALIFGAARAAAMVAVIALVAFLLAR